MNESYPHMNESYPQMNESYPHMNESYIHMNESYPHMNEPYPHMNESYPHMNEPRRTYEWCCHMNEMSQINARGRRHARVLRHMNEAYPHMNESCLHIHESCLHMDEWRHVHEMSQMSETCHTHGRRSHFTHTERVMSAHTWVMSAYGWVASHEWNITDEWEASYTWTPESCHKWNESCPRMDESCLHIDKSLHINGTSRMIERRHGWLRDVTDDWETSRHTHGRRGRLTRGRRSLVTHGMSHVHIWMSPLIWMNYHGVRLCQYIFTRCAFMSVHIHTYEWVMPCLKRVTSRTRHTWVHHITWIESYIQMKCVAVCCNELLCVAVCCSVLQRDPVCCSVDCSSHE